jgi:hypothetical protein
MVLDRVDFEFPEIDGFQVPLTALLHPSGCVNQKVIRALPI